MSQHTTHLEVCILVLVIEFRVTLLSVQPCLQTKHSKKVLPVLKARNRRGDQSFLLTQGILCNVFVKT
jgi:hypothetical protein